MSLSLRNDFTRTALERRGVPHDFHGRPGGIAASQCELAQANDSNRRNIELTRSRPEVSNMPVLHIHEFPKCPLWSHGTDSIWNQQRIVPHARFTHNDRGGALIQYCGCNVMRYRSSLAKSVPHTVQHSPCCFWLFRAHAEHNRAKNRHERANRVCNLSSKQPHKACELLQSDCTSLLRVSRFGPIFKQYSGRK